MVTASDDRLVNAIQLRMIALNMDLSDLAKASGIKSSNLIRILSLKYSPSVDVYERLGICVGLKLCFKEFS